MFSHRFDPRSDSAKLSAMITEHITPAPNQVMERTSGSFGSLRAMKFHPQPAAARSPASRR